MKEMQFQRKQNQKDTIFLLYVILLLKCCHGFQFPTTGEACIIVNLDADIHMTQLGTNPIEISSDLTNAKVLSGRCANADESSSSLVLETTGKLPLTMNFLFSKGTNSIVIMDTSITFIPDKIFKNNDTGTQVIVDEGTTRLSKATSSYKCSRERSLPYNIKNSTRFSYELEITISNVVIQAFNMVNGTLSEAEECTDEFTSAVPTTESLSTTKEQGQTTTINSFTSDSTTQGVTTPTPNAPPRNKFSATGENGTCILIDCGIQFQISYNTTDDKVANKIVGVPEKFTIVGNCDKSDNTQTIGIQFYEKWEVKLTFSKNNETTSNVKSYLSRIDLTADLNKEIFPDIETPVFIEDMVKEFNTDTVTASVDGSYRCDEKTSFALQNDFIMNTFDLQYAAFQQNITGFSDSDVTQCSSDIVTNSVIPIAVGSALGALIVIVVIAYVIGRRCQEKGGYDTLH